MCLDADTQVVVGSAFLLEDEEREEPGLRAFLEGHPVRVLYIYMYICINAQPPMPRLPLNPTTTHIQINK